MSFILDRMTIPRRLLADLEADRLMAHLRSLRKSGAIAPDLAADVDRAGRRYDELTDARDEAQRLLQQPVDEETTAQIIATRDRLEGLHAAWVAACRGLTGTESAGSPSRSARPETPRAKANVPKLRLRRRARGAAHDGSPSSGIRGISN
jgi:hypothetical protein